MENVSTADLIIKCGGEIIRPTSHSSQQKGMTFPCLISSM